MKKYTFQEERTEYREITYYADSAEEAYKKWEDGYTPNHATEWEHEDDSDNEINLVEIFPIRGDDE